MSASLRTGWTQEQFFAWQGDGDTRYEFDGAEPVAMVGNTVAHGIILRNLHRCLDRGLDGSAFQYLGPTAGLATGDGAVRYPDALITCSPFKGTDYTIPGVVAVFEVVSPTSIHNDRLVKVREYAAVPSIVRYVIIDSTVAGLTNLERLDGTAGWATTARTLNDTIVMLELGIELRVADLYIGVDFGDEAAAG